MVDPRVFVPIFGKMGFCDFSFNRLYINKIHKNQVRFFAIFCDFCAIFAFETHRNNDNGRLGFLFTRHEGNLGLFSLLFLGKSFFSLFGLIACIPTRYEKTKCDFSAILVRFCAKILENSGLEDQGVLNTLFKNRIFRTKSHIFAPIKVLIDNKLSLFCDFAIFLFISYNY